MKHLITLLVAALGLSAFAATYYGTDGTCVLNGPTGWADANGDQPDELTTDDLCIIKDGNTSKKLSTTTGNFVGGVLQLGEPNAKKGGSLSANNNTTISIPACEFYGGAIYLNGETYMTITGAITVFANENDSVSPTIGSRNTSSNKLRNVEIAASLLSAADAVLNIKFGYGDKTTDMTVTNKLTLSGNMSGFKGSVVAFQPLSKIWGAADAPNPEQLNRIVLTSTTAMGDVSAERDDALLVKQGNALEIASAVTQSSARGITFDVASGKAVCLGTANVGDWTLSAPCTGGTDATLEKIDDGTVTVTTPLGFTNIVVGAGTLVLKTSATVPAGTVVTVEKGATLRYSSALAGSITVRGDGEATLEPMVFEFDGTKLTGEPVTVSESFSTGGSVVPLKLSQAFTIPFSATNRVTVLRIPNGTLTAADFSDVTPKTCGLPVTWIEVDNETEPGYQRVAIVARPAIMQTAKSIVDETSTVWSEAGQPMHAGADYFHIKSIAGDYSGPGWIGSGGHGTSIDLTAGESYTLENRGLSVYVANTRFGTVRFYGGTDVTLIYSSKAEPVEGRMYRRIDGDFYLDAALTESNWFDLCLSTLTADYPDNEVCADFCGAGCMRIYNVKSATVEKPAMLRLTGDNSALTGKVQIGKGDTDYPIVVSITNSLALGGSLTSAQAKGIAVYGKVDTYGRTVLKTEKSMTFDDANRGWNVAYGTLRTVADTVLTIKSPLTIANTLYKDGAGVLCLGGANAGTDMPLVVKEGYVMAASATAFSPFALSMADLVEGGFAVDAVAADSGTGVNPKALTLPADASVKLRVRVLSYHRMLGNVTRTILTAPAGTPDLRDRLQAERTKGAVVTLSSQENGDGSVTWFANIEPSGLVLLVE